VNTLSYLEEIMTNHERHTPESIRLEETARCPYCREETALQLPPNYAPVYVHCIACGRRFIAERIKNGLNVFRLENAPCSSDPDCRETEMGQGQEE
jgi:DNA-directed RNA polymerase subunit RPC12/RpoP